MGEGLEGTGTRMRQRLVPALRELGPLLAGLALIAAVGAGFAWSQRPGDPPTTGRAPVAAVTPEAPTGTVRGVVTGVDGDPVEGVLVQVVTAPFEAYLASPNPASVVHPGPTWSDTTDADGAYEISRVTAGPHRVVVAPGGGEWATWWLGDAAVVDDADDVQVAEGEVVRLDLTALPAARIRGTVREPAAADGALAESWNLEGAVTEVVVERRTDDAWVEVTRVSPGRNGRYEVDGLAAGDHRVLVDSPLSGVVHAPSAISEDDASTIALEVGQAVEVDVDVPVPALVTGRLTTSTGLPLADREIAFATGWRVVDPRFPAVATESRTVRTDADGRYAVRLGTEVWTASTDQRCGATEPLPKKAVVAGKDRTWDLVDDAVATVSGRVTGPDGAPRAGVEVLLSGSKASCGQSATTGVDGRWAVTRVPPGRTRVEYVVNTRRAQLRYHHPGTDDPRRRVRIDVPLGADVTGVDATLP